MISKRKLKANQINSKASTGPKTTQGKTNSARNSRRHGLNFPVLADPALSLEVEYLTCEIAGQGAFIEILEPARRIAEAQIDLVRIRKARLDRLAEHPKRRDFELHNWYIDLEEKSNLQFLIDNYVAASDKVPTLLRKLLRKANKKPSGFDITAAMECNLTRELVRIYRYERRALSRRKFAIRDLTAARENAALACTRFG